MKQGGSLGTLKDIGVLFVIAIAAYGVLAVISLAASLGLAYGFWDILWRVSGFCGVAVILLGGVLLMVSRVTGKPMTFWEKRFPNVTLVAGLALVGLLLILGASIAHDRLV